jgi:hypothetical protein
MSTSLSLICDKQYIFTADRFCDILYPVFYIVSQIGAGFHKNFNFGSVQNRSGKGAERSSPILIERGIA